MLKSTEEVRKHNFHYISVPLLMEGNPVDSSVFDGIRVRVGQYADLRGFTRHLQKTKQGKFILFLK